MTTPVPRGVGSTVASATGEPDGGVRFGADGLVPAVAQDAASGDVLMVAFINAEALAKTRETGRAHYWSRSRGTIWRKGETSGHEQVVDEILINCERNSLLLRVRQVGAVCHDGYATCFYRRLEANDALTILRERVFDPAQVYGATPGTGGRAVSSEPAGGSEPASTTGGDPLEGATRLLYGALLYLRDNDLSAFSRTSVRLRRKTDTVTPRAVEEMRELAGVLEGTHRHGGLREDALLEGTQVLYWVLLAAVRAGVPWDRLRPDRALATIDDGMDLETAGRLLRAEAGDWERGAAPGDDHGARCHAALALVAQACGVGGVGGLELVETDLGEMRGRAYLGDYFSAAG